MLCRQYRLRRRSARTAFLRRLFVTVSVSHQPRCTMWSSKAWTVVLGLVIAVTGKNAIILHVDLLAFVLFSVFNGPSPIIARLLFGFLFIFVSSCPLTVGRSRFKWNIICWTGPLKTAVVNASTRRVHPLRNTDNNYVYRPDLISFEIRGQKKKKNYSNTKIEDNFPKRNLSLRFQNNYNDVVTLLNTNNTI